MNTVISFFHLNRHCAILSLVAISLLWNINCSQTHAQEEAVTDAEASPLYVVRFIEVAPENVAKWRQAVKTKQQKFNAAKDSSKWGTWRIITGPRTNQFARGFLTTRELYSNPVHPVQGGLLGNAEAAIGSRIYRHFKRVQGTSRYGADWGSVVHGSTSWDTSTFCTTSALAYEAGNV